MDIDGTVYISSPSRHREFGPSRGDTLHRAFIKLVTSLPTVVADKQSFGGLKKLQASLLGSVEFNYQVLVSRRRGFS